MNFDFVSKDYVCRFIMTIFPKVLILLDVCCQPTGFIAFL
jgi:hypothetical protein